MKILMNTINCRWFLVCALLSMGCAGRPAVLSSADREALRERAADAHGNGGGAPRIRTRATPVPKARPATGAEELVLPRPPRNSLWADGRAASQAEAVRQARRQVSEQIVSRISSESRTMDSMDNGREDVQSSLKIRTTSQFKHAELIKTTGVIRDGTDFVARVVLNKAEAINVYSRELALLRSRVERGEPTLKRAIETLNTAVLLNTKWAPTALLKKQLKKAQILNLLGKRTEVKLNDRQQTLAKKAVSIRSQAIIRLKVTGQAPALLKRAVVGKLGAILAERNCRFAMHDGQAPKAGVPTADAHLRIVTRDHEEFGALWRYVGFELYIVDARSKSPLFHLTALPEFVHGGGPSWAMADQAVIRRMEQKLRVRYLTRFEELGCR